MAVLDELARTADRFEKWAQVQDAARDLAIERRMEQARVRFQGARFLDIDDQVFFEQIVEGDDLLPIRYFEMGQLAARPVGRLRIDLGPSVGEGYATGFLIAPGVLLTNWHVLKSEEFALAATVAFDAEDDIRGIPKPPVVFRLEPGELFFADRDLDFAVTAVSALSTDGHHAIERFGYLRLFPQTGKITRDEYATVIQHPRGRQKQVAARNNKVLVYVYDAETDAPDNSYLYYASDTMQGSSGAPVLNDQFFVVALHRRGVPETQLVDGARRVVRKDGTPAQPGDPSSMFNYVANEGVRISKILKCLETASDQPAAKRARDAVLGSAGDLNQGPFWVPAAPPTRSSSPRDADESLFEIVHRKAGVFAEAEGYRPDFLNGFDLPLPEPSDALRARLAPRTDVDGEYVLPFRHFSTAIHAGRRMPVFAAVNIDGRMKSAPGAMPRRPSWSYDPRISEDHQLDDTIFSSMLQRGHMAARDFVYWGEEAATADVHSFTLSNVCPQIGRFNGNREWARLERNIIALATSGKRRVTVFVGPVFSKTDPLYDELRGDASDATVGTGIRLPKRFWYIACWVQEGALSHKAFLLDQSDDIEEAGPLEADLPTPNLVTETSIANIAKLTGLRFSGLE